MMGYRNCLSCTHLPWVMYAICIGYRILWGTGIACHAPVGTVDLPTAVETFAQYYRYPYVHIPKCSHAHMLTSKADLRHRPSGAGTSAAVGPAAGPLAVHPAPAQPSPGTPHTLQPHSELLEGCWRTSWPTHPAARPRGSWRKSLQPPQM